MGCRASVCSEERSGGGGACERAQREAEGGRAAAEKARRRGRRVPGAARGSARRGGAGAAALRLERNGRGSKKRVVSTAWASGASMRVVAKRGDGGEQRNESMDEKCATTKKGARGRGRGGGEGAKRGTRRER